MFILAINVIFPLKELKMSTKVTIFSSISILCRFPTIYLSIKVPSGTVVVTHLFVKKY